MRYDIHYAPRPNGRVGIEVQPPVKDVVLPGIMADITSERIDSTYGAYRIAAVINVTRQDEEGTVFVAAMPGGEGRKKPPLERALFVAEAVGAALDPCEIHEIVYHGYDLPS